jgi:hypothetical protein
MYGYTVNFQYFEIFLYRNNIWCLQLYCKRFDCKKTFDFEAISSFYFVSVCIFFMFLESCFTHSYLIFICIFIFGWFLFLRSWPTWMVYPKVHFLHIILCLVMIHLWHLDLWPSLTWMQICQVRLFLVGYISTLSPLHLVIDITQCNN